MPLLLVPAILAVVGLYSGRDGLVWLAVALFVWLSWDRQRKALRRSLFSVPMPRDSVKVPEFGGGELMPEPASGPRCGGCA
jgi:hypothetical protein